MAKELTDIREILNEALTLQQRMKKKQTFKRLKSRIARGRKLAQRRLAPKDKLEKRSQKQARKSIEAKLLGGKSKADLPLAARNAIEKKVNKRSAAIKRLAKKMFPGVRKKEVARLKNFRAGGSK